MSLMKFKMCVPTIGIRNKSNGTDQICRIKRKEADSFWPFSNPFCFKCFQSWTHRYTSIFHKCEMCRDAITDKDLVVSDNRKFCFNLKNKFLVKPFFFFNNLCNTGRWVTLAIGSQIVTALLQKCTLEST